jgi:hypothetical protein
MDPAKRGRLVLQPSLTSLRAHLVIWATLFAFFVADHSFAAATKYQICSITINSNDEIETFKKFLPASDFEFHELSPINQVSSDGSSTALRRHGHYLKTYCSQKQRCDVLIISGHFGGTFTGSANFSLSADEMNSLSCSADCGGIFAAPKEVFLFGCNTLAGKTKDTRTPREYVQVLRVHGYSETEARQISNLRYGPTGGTFLESMQRIFSQTPKVYGFDSISPRGSTDAKMLRNYFNLIGDYKKHLDQLQMSSPANTSLKQAFRFTSFREASGEDSEVRGLMCQILDSSLPSLKKTSLIESAMSTETPLTFIPSIQKAIRENRELKDIFSRRKTDKKTDEVVERIRKNSAVKELLSHALQTLQVMLPTNAFDLMEFSQQIGWFSKEEISLKKSQFYRERLADANLESLTTLCELREYTVALAPSDLNFISNSAFELKKVTCLPLGSGPEFFKAMTQSYFSLLLTKKMDYIKAYEGWVLQALMQNSSLGKSFVELYIQQPDEVFFHALIIQKGLETNAFFYDVHGVLNSLENRIAKNPKLAIFRSRYSALKE